MRHIFLATATALLVFILGSVPALASETTYYRTIEQPDMSAGFIVMIIEARWLIMKLVGFFTPVLVLLFYFSLKYQDKLNVKSANSSKDEMRDMKRFERAVAGNKDVGKAEIVNVRQKANLQDEPEEYVFKRGQISFANAGRSR